MEENKVMKSDVTAMVTSVPQAEIALWSEDKRREFTQTFGQRVRVARYILEVSARAIVDTALHRHFIGQRHAGGVSSLYDSTASMLDRNERGCHGNLVGGRDTKEL
jgi:hypothetical protein